MFKPNPSSSEKCTVNCSSPTAIVIPNSFGKHHSHPVEHSKCPVITITRQLEEEVFKIFTKALQVYKPEEIIFVFNGGKDCTVVLHMLNKFYKNNGLEQIKIPVLYIQSDDHFSEIDLFVDECVDMYNLNLIKRKGGMKEVLNAILQEMTNIKAVFMGNRKTDPHCTDLKIMQATDRDWPLLLRINPILNWSFHDVWSYILIFKVPYCILYEQGYTSIGNRTNTIPNPHLKVIDSTTECDFKYYPAYMLEDGKFERAGRIKMH